MKIIIIGSVAAGTSVAAKARRNTEDVQITVYEKGSYISYSGCGLPYFIGGESPDINALTPRTPKWFKDRYNVDVFTGCEVLAVDKDKKTVLVQNVTDGTTKTDSYDKLVIATGAYPFKPTIEGIDSKNIFTVKSPQNAVDIDNFITDNHSKTVTVIGGGYIGLEMAAALFGRGLAVTIVDVSTCIMPYMDEDMSLMIQRFLAKKGFQIITSAKVTGFNVKQERALSLVTDKGLSIESDLFIWSTGIKPETELAKSIGIKLGITGAIEVNSKMQTNSEDIYAAGDCAEAFSVITGKKMYRPMGSTANKMGRIAGDVITGGNLEFKGVLGTGIFKLFDMTVGMTGLTEKDAKGYGYDVEVVHNIKPNKAEYYPGSTPMTIKAVADKATGKLLGVQIVGGEGVDKRIDIFATAMTYGATVDTLFHLDLAYAPPFATTKDPVHYTGMILDNAINDGRAIITAKELKEWLESSREVIVIDVRSEKEYENKGHIEGALNIPLEKLRKTGKNLPDDATIVTYCNKGVTGNAAQNVLLNMGKKSVYNLSGGYTGYQQLK